MQTITKKQIESQSGSIKEDMRGKHSNRANKTSQLVTDSVHQHIDTFERVESHYCRKNTKREYLDSDLNIQKMYAQYKEWMISRNDKNIASESRYRHIFTSDFNLFFHKPKKDQCEECAAFEFVPGQKLIEMENDHNKHIINKDYARELMTSAKTKAKQDKTICTATFDLQKVLNVPHSQISVITNLCKRKISIYNFTIFDMASKQGICNVWNETDAKRGENEIGSCLWRFIKGKVQNKIKEFNFYNDNCGGQNRKSVLYSMYVKAAVNFNVIITRR